MKRFYSKFRIGLMTFALGLASVFIMNGSLQFSNEIPVNLPKVKSDNVIVIYSRYSSEFDASGGDASGRDTDNYERKKISNKIYKRIESGK